MKMGDDRTEAAGAGGLQGTLEQAYPPLILATTAASIGWGVGIFVTQEDLIPAARCAGATTFLDYAAAADVSLFIQRSLTKWRCWGKDSPPTAEGFQADCHTGLSPGFGQNAPEKLHRLAVLYCNSLKTLAS